MNISKAIPTVYKGIQMRSRLEARWAAFFDFYQLKWQYEPFDCDGWIPDFLVETKREWTGGEYPYPYLFEIKPISTASISPNDVFRKIEHALHLAYPKTLDIFFYTKHRIAVLGTNPGVIWQLQQIKHTDYESDDWHRLHWQVSPLFEKWEEVWPAASNKVQWYPNKHMFG